MKIIRMGLGEAPDTADRVFIDRVPGGRFSWNGSVGRGRAAIFTTGNGKFSSVKAAEAEAIAWANDQGVIELIIETEDGRAPRAITS